jgi:hypothetical protein
MTPHVKAPSVSASFPVLSTTLNCMARKSDGRRIRASYAPSRAGSKVAMESPSRSRGHHRMVLRPAGCEYRPTSTNLGAPFSHAAG